MFAPFFVRCYTSFLRNFTASIMPLAFPLLFLFLFLDATSDAENVPALRLGVVENVVPLKLINAFIDTGLVDVKQLSESFDTENIDVKLHDAVLATTNLQGKENFIIYVRPGFEIWAEAILDRIAYAGHKELVSGIGIELKKVKGNSYLAFIIPGLFVMLLIQLAITSTANLVLNDRTDGTLRIIASVKNAVFPLFAAELLFRLLFTLVCYSIIMTLAYQVSNFSLGENLFSFTLVFIIGSMMMIALGYALGGVLPNRRNWSALITLLGLAFWFFSDILFQASQHPFAKPLSLILPPTYLTDALRQISTGQAGTFSLMFDILMIIFWLIIFTFINVKFFRFETNDDRM